MGSGNTAAIIAILIAFGLTYLMIKALINMFTGGRGKPKHCMTCGTEAPTKKATRGSILIEIVLWLCFIIPGLIYSLWRLSSRKEVCSSCGSETLIPLNAPAAANHRRALTAGVGTAPG
jgi:hypothetical protein